MWYISKVVSWTGFHEETVLKTFESEIEAVEYLRKLFIHKLNQKKQNTAVEFYEPERIVRFEEPCRRVELKIRGVDNDI